MSAIFGILRLNGEEVHARDLERMGNALVHRGPDGRKFATDGPLGFGHCLMRVNQEDTFERQPLIDREAGLTLVADCRIDNREELAAEFGLASADSSNLPDSAFILRAYKAWGAGCAEKLLGDFAFAIWDEHWKELVLGRDHMGQRHVFYHRCKGFFAFATDINGLWALPEVPRNLAEVRMVSTLVFEDPDEVGATNYEGIRAIPGGTVLRLTADGTISTRRYWEPHADPMHTGRDEAYYVETYRKILGEAVACRLRRATTAAGLFMGGGFDSSAICALAGPVVKAQGRKLVAVSSVMPEDYRGSIHHARKWCEMCRRHMPHLDMRYVTREDLDVFTFMARAFHANDGEYSPNGYVIHAILAEIAAAGARIVMDGSGGDPTLNTRGQNALARLLRGGQFRRFAAEFNATRRHLRLSVKQTFVRHVLLRLMPDALTGLWRRHRGKLALFGPTIPLSRELIREHSRTEALRHRRRIEKGRQVGVLRMQQNSPSHGMSVAAAAYGLSITRPFRDKRVVEFGLAIPEALRFKNGKTRYLAREALKELYPPEFQDRPPGNDDMGPDFLMMAKRIEPRVLAEIDRMEKAGYLSRYFDFPRMRKMLTQRSVEQHASGNEYDTRQALLAFLAARRIEWFRGDNR